MCKKGRNGPALREFIIFLYDRRSSPQAEILFLFFLFTVSFIIRYIGLKYSYPFITNGDETLILDPVYEMTKNRSLNPDFFARPDQILYILNFIYLNIISFIKTGKDFSAAFPLDPYIYYFYSRIMIATFGSLTPVVAYKIGKDSSINFSIPAAILFAFFPVYIIHSHYISPDIPVTFFTLVIIFLSTRYISKIDVKYLYLATIFASINTAEKYPGLISLGIIFFAIIWVQIKQNKDQVKFRLIIRSIFLEGLKTLGLYILALFIFAPNIFIQYGKAFGQISIQNSPDHLGADGLSWLGNMNYYLTNFLSYSNVVFILMTIIGLVGMVKAKKYDLLPCFYGLIYWICLSVLSLHWERWGLPMYTFPLLLAAFGLGFLLESLKSKRLLRLIAVIVFSLSMVWSLLFSLSFSIRFSYTDTRTAALRYCEAAGITQDNSAYEGYTPFNPGDPSAFSLSEINSTTKYILLSSGMYNRYYNEPSRYAKQIMQYETVKKEYPLIMQFSPTSPSSSIREISWVNELSNYIQRHLGKTLPERFRGPTILIYRVH